MKIVLALPLVVVLYGLLLITSFVSRMMAVVSVTLAAAYVNMALWSGSSWLLDKLNLKEEK